MTAQITPEPTPEEREALLRALAALERVGSGPSGWWEAGIREVVDDDAEGSAFGWDGLAKHGLCSPGESRAELRRSQSSG